MYLFIQIQPLSLSVYTYQLNEASFCCLGHGSWLLIQSELFSSLLPNYVCFPMKGHQRKIGNITKTANKILQCTSTNLFFRFLQMNTRTQRHCQQLSAQTQNFYVSWKGRSLNQLFLFYEQIWKVTLETFSSTSY